MPSRKTLENQVGNIAVVTWLDAMGKHGWHSEADVMKAELPTIRSVGWIVGVSERALHMAADKDEFEQFNSIGLIPLKWILGVEKLG